MLIDWLKNAFAAPEKLISEIDIALAAIGLVIEVMHADHHCSDEEVAALRIIATEIFSVSPTDLDAVIANALGDHRNRVSIQPLTRLINEKFPAEKKAALIKALWKIAYADGDLEKYEENTIRKIADLLYIPHAVFIKMKLQVSEEHLLVRATSKD